ncbi:MAG: DUF2314 domain-containing protein [Verrucomicrobiota bacterium]
MPFRLILWLIVGRSDLVGLPDDHPEMLAAKKKARESLPGFFRIMEGHSEELTEFSVKVAFPTDLGDEHIWVSDLSLEARGLKGLLANDPNNIPGIKLGDEVVVEENRISDWSYCEGGVFQGHFTTKVLLPHMKEEMREQVMLACGWENEKESGR